MDWIKRKNGRKQDAPKMTVNERGAPVLTIDGQEFEGVRLNPDSGLDDLEHEASERLIDFWKAYMALPEQHPDERFQLNVAVHSIQELLAMRIARRMYPNYWPTWTREDAEERPPTTLEETAKV